MPGGTLSVALTGISAASDRLQASGHNLANTVTEGFHPVRVEQIDQGEATGGVRVEISRSEQPEEVDIAREFLQADFAALQARASMRVMETDLELLGRLIDLQV